MTDKQIDERAADRPVSAEPEPASVGYAPGAGLPFRIPKPSNFGWTDERTDYLKRRWAERLSAAVIAAELGITRNAVIGKIHRLGLHRAQRQPKPRIDRKPARSRPIPQPACGKRYVIPWVEVPFPVEQTNNPVALLDLQAHQCRWPVSAEGEPFMFCGGVSWLHFSYCLRHCSIAFRDEYRGPRAERELRVRNAIRNYRKRKAA